MVRRSGARARGGCAMASMALFLLVLALAAGPSTVGVAAVGVAAQEGDAASPVGQSEPGRDGLIASVHSILIIPSDDQAARAGDTAANEGHALTVLETVVLTNASSAATEAIVFPLFAGAERLELLSGFAGSVSQRSAAAFRATVTIPAGARQAFSFAYRVRIASPPTSLVRAVVRPTERLLIMVPEGAPWEPLAVGLRPAGSERFAGREVDVYVAEAVAPTAEWVLGLRPRSPAAPAGADAGRIPVVDHHVTDQQGMWRHVLVALTIALLVWGGLFLRDWLRERQVGGIARLPAWVEEPELLSHAERQQLAERVLTAAVELERAWRSQRLDARVYGEVRQRLQRAWKYLHLPEAIGDRGEGRGTS